MSKKTDIFKSKKFLTGIAVGASVIIVGSSTLGIMLPSYFSWKEYYDAAIADRDYQKYLQTLPLEITGLSASVNDNVTYYDNGKAAPQSAPHKTSGFIILSISSSIRFISENANR